jgi:hypothetical protein
MAFQIKSFLSITASMLNYSRAVTGKVTDYIVGSVTRTIFEAIAQELDQLYQNMVHGLEEAIPVATYNSFDFGAMAAVAAAGLIQVQITPQATAVVIAANSTLTDENGVVYTVTADTTIPIGSSLANVPCAAATAGSAGNVAAGDTFTLAPAPAGFLSATAIAAITNGVDAETDAARKLRFQAYIQTIGKATTAALVYGASTTQILDASGNIQEQVKLASFVEPYKTDTSQPVALVWVYVHNGIGGTSPQLVAQAQLVVDGYYAADGTPVVGWKAAGVNVIVYAATENPINLAAVLTGEPNVDEVPLVAQATAIMSAYILALGLGVTCKLAYMVGQIMAIPGVANFVWLGDPSDIVAATNIKPMPGTLAVSGSSLLAAAPALASGSIGTLSTAIHLAANAFSDLSVSAAPSGAW